MNMRRQFRNRQRMRLLTGLFAQRVAVAGVNRRSALQVRQGKIGLAVPAISRAEQRKERLVLVDRQQLPIAQRPAFRRELETHDSDFAQEGFSHKSKHSWAQPGRTVEYGFVESRAGHRNQVPHRHNEDHETADLRLREPVTVLAQRLILVPAKEQRKLLRFIPFHALPKGPTLTGIGFDQLQPDRSLMLKDMELSPSQL